jgi:phage-related protein
MWEIEYFEKDNGRCPVEEYLAELSPKKDLPYIMNAFDQLAEIGNRLQRPHAAHLEDEIWELRVKTINGQFRFFYFFFGEENQIIITHGFKKKTRQIPKIELARAKEYRSIYLSRKGKKQ